jgi:hypothetical protein
LLPGERALAADTHHEHPLAGTAVDIEQRGLADPPAEIAAFRKPRKPAVEARIERYRGCGESAALVDAYDCAIGATPCGCAADRMETHLPPAPASCYSSPADCAAVCPPPCPLHLGCEAAPGC